MPNRFLPHALARSADSVRDDARAKAVRASYEFWSTGDEALLERAFAETFAEHAARPNCAPAKDGFPAKQVLRGVGERRRHGPAQSIRHRQPFDRPAGE